MQQVQYTKCIFNLIKVQSQLELSLAQLSPSLCTLFSQTLNVHEINIPSDIRG